MNPDGVSCLGCGQPEAKISERQRRKEETIALAMAHAAIRGETMRVQFADEATAKRQFQTVCDELSVWTAPEAGVYEFQIKGLRVGGDTT